jgi:nucleoid-associated protein YgaU
MATALVVFVGVLFVVVVAFGGRPSGASGDQVGPSAPNGASVTWVVRSGDTPWSIARAVQPQGDVRPLVSEIERSLDGEPLRVGQRITIG